MPKEEQVEDDGHGQTDSLDDPNETCPEHTKQDDCLELVVLRHDANVDEELCNRGLPFWCRMFTRWYEFEFHDRVQGDPVDDLTWSFGKDNAHPGFE